MGTPLIGQDNRFNDASPATVTVTPSAEAGFPVANLSDDRAFTIYTMSVAASPLDIVTDIGVGKTAKVGYFMLVGHNLKTLGDAAPVGDGNGACDVNFAHSADGIAYTTIFSISGVPDDFIIARAFATITNRFFRLRITRATDFVASVGEVAWGEPVVFPFGVPVGFDPNAEMLNARSNRSQTGNIVGATQLFTERRATIDLKFVESSFVDGTAVGDFREWWDNHGQKMEPFLFMWNAVLTATNTVNEKDSFFGVVDPGSLRRPLATQVAQGFRNLAFEIVGLKENQ